MNKGFTLIEVLIVVSIIAVASSLVAVSLPNFNSEIESKPNDVESLSKETQVLAVTSYKCYKICQDYNGETNTVPLTHILNSRVDSRPLDSKCSKDEQDATVVSVVCPSHYDISGTTET